MENTAVTKKIKISEEPVGTVSIVLHDSDDDIPDLDSDSSDDESKNVRPSSFVSSSNIGKPLLQRLSDGIEKCSLQGDKSNEGKHIPVRGHAVEKEVQLSNKRKLGECNGMKPEVDSIENRILKRQEAAKIRRKESYRKKNRNLSKFKVKLTIT